MTMNQRMARRPGILHAVAGSVLLATLLLPVPAITQEEMAAENESSADQAESMTLKGDDDGTVLRSLTIEGEDRRTFEGARKKGARRVGFMMFREQDLSRSTCTSLVQTAFDLGGDPQFFTKPDRGGHQER